jgi:hypothetical protein
MFSTKEIFGYFIIFFISCLIGFFIIYKHYKFKVNNYKPNLCVEKILARCAPMDESEKQIRNDRSRSRGGLSEGAKSFFSDENMNKIVERYVSKEDPKYNRIMGLFKKAFDREDEEMLICLEKHMTSFNFEPSCLNLEQKPIGTGTITLYFLSVIGFAIAVTLFAILISSFIA